MPKVTIPAAEETHDLARVLPGHAALLDYLIMQALENGDIDYEPPQVVYHLRLGAWDRELFPMFLHDVEEVWIMSVPRES